MLQGTGPQGGGVVGISRTRLLKRGVWTSCPGPFPPLPPYTAADFRRADTDAVPSISFPHPEFPYTPSPEHGRRSGQVPTAIIGGVAGSVLLVLIVVGGIVVALRRRRHTFKGDYSTKKHVYGNGYSKAGIPQHHPPMAQNLQYPDDSDDEKKAGPLGGSSYEEEEEEEGGGGGERKVGGPHPKYDEDAKRPYFTVDEAEARQDGYGDRTLGYQYDPEQLDLAENMVSQNDGSFISKKEWYV
ncbi:nectin-1 [Onychomys torridus]|uniref:nectin-1 n=1 Tax=Onychomys torridus TaxID=38674 RepID=UPI00167F7850|nr:nectin-1 [Onychomys torridus]